MFHKRVPDPTFHSIPVGGYFILGACAVKAYRQRHHKFWAAPRTWGSVPNLADMGLTTRTIVDPSGLEAADTMNSFHLHAIFFNNNKMGQNYIPTFHVSGAWIQLHPTAVYKELGKRPTLMTALARLILNKQADIWKCFKYTVKPWREDVNVQ